ncbi:hypothetical protein C3L33_15284, partial [Rhododendron williamsianum]
MIEHKRGPISIDQSSHTAFAPKRHKADLSISSKETKEKLGEKIAALQQLVSPYGKTDTASVLLEAMEYITFLHEQVTVLSAPYLQSIPTANMQIEKNETRNNAYAIVNNGIVPDFAYSFDKEIEPYSLRSKGLCLVPISWTSGVDSSNGADIWAPIKTTSPKY